MASARKLLILGSALFTGYGINKRPLRPNYERHQRQPAALFFPRQVIETGLPAASLQEIVPSEEGLTVLEEDGGHNSWKTKAIRRRVNLGLAGWAGGTPRPPPETVYPPIFSHLRALDRDSTRAGLRCCLLVSSSGRPARSGIGFRRARMAVPKANEGRKVLKTNKVCDYVRTTHSAQRADPRSDLCLHKRMCLVPRSVLPRSVASSLV